MHTMRKQRVSGHARKLLLNELPAPEEEAAARHVTMYYCIIIIMLPNQAIASTPSAPRPSGAEGRGSTAKESADSNPLADRHTSYTLPNNAAALTL
jgi:hypothetical protein